MLLSSILFLQNCILKVVKAYMKLVAELETMKYYFQTCSDSNEYSLTYTIFIYDFNIM